MEKETNNHLAEIERLRQSLYALEEQVIKLTQERDEVRAILSAVCNVSNKEREDHKQMKQENEKLKGQLADALENRDRWFRKWERMAEIARKHIDTSKE